MMWGSDPYSATVTARTVCRPSMLQWFWVQASFVVRPVFTTSRPEANQGAVLVRSA